MRRQSKAEIGDAVVTFARGTNALEQVARFAAGDLGSLGSEIADANRIIVSEISDRADPHAGGFADLDEIAVAAHDAAALNTRPSFSAGAIGRRQSQLPGPGC